MKHEDIFETNTLILSKGHDGFWLWDETRGMNLAMKEPSEREALINALEYYQDRLNTVESELEELKNKVDSFLGQFNEEEA
jgi:hypothetical protein